MGNSRKSLINSDVNEKSEWMKIIEPNVPWYDELCRKILYKFRSNLNLPCALNEKYTAKFPIGENFHHIITFQLNDFSLANKKSPFQKDFSPYFACMQIPSFCEKLDTIKSLTRLVSPETIRLSLFILVYFLQLFHSPLNLQVHS